MEKFRSEIFFGLVAPVGVDLDQITRLIEDYLPRYIYKTHVIRLSELISSVPGIKIKIDNSSPFKRIDTAMTAGNEARKITGREDILAAHSIIRVQEIRGSPEPKQSNAYVFRSLKHYGEVDLFRSIYGKGFFLLGFSSSRKKKSDFLRDRKGMTKDEANYLINRDEVELDKFGQHTRDAFNTSDVFFDVDSNNFSKDLKRFFDLIFGNPYITPTKDEFAMFLAFSSSFRSGDLSRQVGAIILSDKGETIATGWNDVPKKGGSLYCCDDGENDHRDFKIGYDFNKRLKDNMAKRILSLIEKNCSKEALGKVKEGLKETGLHDITEYGRAVHAEMEALLSCARSGVSPRNGTLYTTTFPCHNCAKHIVASGIQRVVFVEPYPKSKALILHEDAIRIDTEYKGNSDKVILQPFVGIGPRKFIDLFSLHLSNGVKIKREDGGSIIKWLEAKALFRFPILGLSYLEKETWVGFAIAKGGKNVKKKK